MLSVLLSILSVVAIVLLDIRCKKREGLHIAIVTRRHAPSSTVLPSWSLELQTRIRGRLQPTRLMCSFLSSRCCPHAVKRKMRRNQLKARKREWMRLPQKFIDQRKTCERVIEIILLVPMAPSFDDLYGPVHLVSDDDIVLDDWGNFFVDEEDDDDATLLSDIEMPPSASSPVEVLMDMHSPQPFDLLDICEHGIMVPCLSFSSTSTFASEDDNARGDLAGSFHERLQETTRNLQESIRKSRETRLSLVLKSDKTAEFAEHIEKVVLSVEESANQLQALLDTKKTAVYEKYSCDDARALHTASMSLEYLSQFFFRPSPYGTTAFRTP